MTVPNRFGSARRPASSQIAPAEALEQRLVLASNLPDLVDHDRSLSATTSQRDANSVELGGTLTVTALIRNAGDAPAANVPVSLYLSTNNVITTSDKRIGTASIEKITAGSSAEVKFVARIPEDISVGNYYVGWIIDPEDVIQEHDDSRASGYMPDPLTVLSRILNPDSSESNNSFSSPTNLGGIGSPFSLGSRTIHSGSDVDYYQFRAISSGTHTVDIDFEHDDGDLDLAIYRNDGTIVGRSRSRTDNESVTFTATANHQYIVKVEGFSDEINRYSLSIQPPSLTPDPFEPDNTFETAHDLGTPFGAHTSGVNIHSGSDRDYVTFTAAETGLLELEITFTHAEGDLALEAFDANRQSIAAADSRTDDERLRFWAVEGERYYAAVSSAVGTPNTYAFGLGPANGHPGVVGFDAQTGRWQSNRIDGNFDRLAESRGDVWNAERNLSDIMIGDFNGDEYSDVIGRDRGTGEWFVSLGVPEGFEHALSPESRWADWQGWQQTANWVDFVVGDFNGDRRDDILARTQNGGVWLMAAVPQPTHGAGSFADLEFLGSLPNGRWSDFLVGDFTGDRRLDVMTRNEAGGGWWMLPFQDADDERRLLPPRFVAGWDAGRDWVDVYALDLDGDGVRDIIARADDGDAWYAMTADGEGGFSENRWLTRMPGNFEYDDVTVRDATGDGVADVIARRSATGEWIVLTGRRSGDGFQGFDAPTTWATWNGWRLRMPWLHTQFLDYDRDGRLDILSQAREGGNWWLMRGNDAGTAFDAAEVIEVFDVDETFDQLFLREQDSSVDRYQGSYDGDDRPDLIGLSRRSGGVLTAEAEPITDGQPLRMTTRTAHTGWNPYGTYRNIGIGDLDGDGLRDDVVGRDNSTGEWVVMLGNALQTGEFDSPEVWGRWENWTAQRTWTNLHIEDLNGDGRDDILLRNDRGAVWQMLTNATADGFLEESYVMSLGSNVGPIQTLDVNADGRADLAMRNTMTGDWQLAIAHSGGRTYGTPEVVEHWTTSTGWTDLRTGDIDGDGREDIVGRAVNGGGWWAMLANANGTGFLAERWVGRFDPAVGWENVSLADLNGDGKLDLLGRSSTTGTWSVLLANGSNSLFDSTRPWGAWEGWKSRADWQSVLIDDFNLDGRADVLGRTSGGGWWLMLANSTGTGFHEEALIGSWSGRTRWTFTGSIQFT